MNIIHFPIKTHHKDQGDMRRKFEEKLKQFSTLKDEFIAWAEELEREGKDFLEDESPIPYSQTFFEHMLQDFDLRKLAAYYFDIPSNQKRMN